MNKIQSLLIVLLVFLAQSCTENAPIAVQPAEEAPISVKGDLPAKEDDVPNWHTKDSFLDAVEGTSADRAYDELALTAGEKILVAVIDSGVDTTHEDLQGKIWTNPGEIAGDGIDNDGNGYIDDIHGWNFLGKVVDGKPVHLKEAPLEVTRELVRMKKLKADREAIGAALDKKEQKYLNKLQAEVTKDKEKVEKALAQNTALKKAIEKQFTVLSAAFKSNAVELDKLTLKDVNALDVSGAELNLAKQKLQKLFEFNKVKTVARIVRRIEYYSMAAKYYYNEEFSPRQEMVGDDVNDINDTAYGNPDVKGPDASHGTHVSGIIAANRHNQLGVMGIADNVEIMALRAVPDGDEYDKDVALAVRYAVDHGARIINMSFGKSYSPGKKIVDDAFLYAAQNNVLIIHSAGNSGRVTTKDDNFPNAYALNGQTIQGWLEVGASSSKKDEDLPAEFSNYGIDSVDVFAPGVAVMSTVPGNQYDAYSGTSMAGPAAAGVAALVLSQYPLLSAKELKDVLMWSAIQYPGLSVLTPSDDDFKKRKHVPFASLSRTGGVVNAYNALLIAAGLQ